MNSLKILLQTGIEIKEILTKIQTKKDWKWSLRQEIKMKINKRGYLIQKIKRKRKLIIQNL